MSKTLVIQNLQGIGDYMWFLRHVHALARHTPDQKVTLLTRPRSFADQLSACDPMIDDVIWLHMKPGLHDGVKGLWTLAKTLRQKKFECVYILHSRSLRYLFLCRLAGISKIYGPGVGLQKWGLSHPSKALSPVDQKRHPIQRATALLRNHGIETEPPGDILPLPLEHVSAAKKILKNLKPPFVALCIGSSEVHKKWPADHFIALGQSIHKSTKATILVLGGANEAAEGKTIEAKLQHGGIPSLFVTGHLLTTLSVLKHCHFLVGNDTGVTHAAPMLGVNALVLLGQTQVPIHDYAPIEGVQAMSKKRASLLEDHHNKMDSLEVSQVYQRLRTLKWV